MALFGNKQENLQSLLKKIQDPEKTPSNLDEILRLIESHSEFTLERYVSLFTHRKQPIRQWATKLVGTQRRPELADRLIREMVGKPADVRREIAAIVMRIGADRARIQLGVMAHHKKPELRQAALDLITATANWKEFLGHIKFYLHDPEKSIRHAAASILATDVENPTVFLMLRNYINDPDTGLRRIIIKAFCRLGTPEIVEPFFERMLVEGPEDRRLMLGAIGKLARSSPSRIEAHILPMLADESLEVRELAVRVLKEMPDQTRVLRAFLLHCKGLASWLRDRSIQSIVKICHDIVAPLIELMRDEDEDVRVGAMVMANQTDDARIVPCVQEIFLGNSDWWIRSMAADVMGRFANPEIARTLVSKIEDPDLSYSAILVLGKVDLPEARDAVVKCLAHPKTGIRLAAITALKESDDTEIMQFLGEVAKDDANERVRKRAKDALEHFGHRSKRVLAELEEKAEREAAASPSGLQLEMADEALNSKR